MKPEINDLLSGVRKLVEQYEDDYEDEEEISDYSSEVSEPGDLGAENEPSAVDAVTKYIYDVADKLLDDFDISEDDAVGFVFDVAGMFSDEGLLPPVPAADDPEVLKSEWLGAAGSIGFAAEVLQAAEELAEE